MSARCTYAYYGDMKKLKGILDPIKQDIRDLFDPNVNACPSLTTISEALQALDSRIILTDYAPYSAGCGTASAKLVAECGRVEMQFICEEQLGNF